MLVLWMSDKNSLVNSFGTGLYWLGRFWINVYVSVCYRDVYVFIYLDLILVGHTYLQMYPFALDFFNLVEYTFWM